MRSAFLVPRPSFLSGIGTVIDVWGGGTVNYTFKAPAEDFDSRALLSDWLVVSGDLFSAMVSFELERTPPPEQGDLFRDHRAARA